MLEALIHYGVEVVAGMTLAVSLYVAKQIGFVRNQLKLNHFEIKAMDHAISKSIGNGYEKLKSDKLEELQRNDNFIYKG